MEAQRQPIKFHFGPNNNNEHIFSEIEKIIIPLEKTTENANANDDDGNWGEEAEEKCSELWNEIKDAMVLEGMELTDSLLAQFQSRANHLAQQIKKLSQTKSIENAKLRFGTVLAALAELKKKKKIVDLEGNNTMERGFGVQISRSNCIGQFRKWLQQQEAEMGRIRQRIPCSKNCIQSLRELELEQKAQQEQIQTEGRAKHQQLCSILGSNGDNAHSPPDKEDSRICEPLEQRYLALWLASLESLELISHFKARLATKKCPEESFLDSELEEGPDPKRRKTSSTAVEEFQTSTANKMSEFQKQSNLTVPKLSQMSGFGGEKQKRQQQMMGSDIGYSSGENNSIHEGTTNTNSLEENVLEQNGPKEGFDQMENNYVLPPMEPLWSEQIALSSELEKSFYRTVPLDEFGMTDLDTDEGGGGGHQWPKGNYLAHKFMMDELEKGNGGGGGSGAALELTDSLIVHVDAPENRQLNDFEEIMDILDNQQQQEQENGNHPAAGRSSYCFSEDDCESHSSGENWQQRHLPPGSSRKRTLAKTPMANFTNKPTTDLTARRRRQQQNGHRKWAQVRKSRSSNDGCWAGAGMWSSSNYMSSDFEWDEDFGGMAGMRRGNHRHSIDIDNIEANGLPKDIDDGDEHAVPMAMAMARKKALCAFRNGLRQAAAESGNVNVRLRELLALVDKSLGGVDSAAYLLAEIQSTFTALSGFCKSLESRMGRIWLEKCGKKEECEKENAETPIRISHIKDIESELMLCHERMNALETTCNNLALLLGKHLSDGHCPMAKSSDQDYLAQFAGECNRIREELQKLKNRFGEKFTFASIQLPADGGIPNKQQQEPRVNFTAQKTIAINTKPSFSHADHREASFWRSYLLLCLLGFVASLGTLLYANSQQSMDWRWSFGPQLHYENGAPPI